MFLHIGDNNLIKTKDVIGVFDYQSLKKSEENQKLLNTINEEEIAKTIVVCDNQNYYTNISVSTIGKRINHKIKSNILI